MSLLSVVVTVALLYGTTLVVHGVASALNAYPHNPPEHSFYYGITGLLILSGAALLLVGAALKG